MFVFLLQYLNYIFYINFKAYRVMFYSYNYDVFSLVSLKTE